MKIDSHTHIEGLPGCPWLDPPEMILGLIDEADIDKAVVMTYVDAPGSFGDYNPLQYVQDAFEKYPDRLIGYARLNPLEGDKSKDLLRECISERGFMGLKLHPYGYRSLPEGKTTVELIKVAAQLNAPTLFHCADEECTLPIQVARAAAAVPNAAIIMGHMGGYFHVDSAIRMAKKYENIYLETSAMPYPYKIYEAVEAIGAERVLFASDGPGCDPKLELFKVKLAKLGREKEKLVLGENIMRLLDKVKG